MTIPESITNQTNANKLLDLVKGDPCLKHFHICLAQSIILIKLDASFGKQALELNPILSLSYIPSPKNEYLLIPFCTPRDFKNYPKIKKRMEPGYRVLEDFIQEYAMPIPKKTH